MKRKLTSILIASTLILSVGCSSNNNDDTTTDKSISNITSNNNEKKIYELHEELYPKVKELHNEYGFGYDEYEEINNKFYNGYRGIEFINDNEVNNGDVSVSVYELDIKDNKANGVLADLYMEVDSDEIVNNGFKMEDTLFAAMDKIMIGEDIDYTELNNNIVNAYKNGGFYDETIEYKNGNCRITTDSSMIQYTIGIYPEE